MGTTATVVVDGVDVTESVVEGSTTTRLNRVSDAQIKVQMQALSDGFGTAPAGVGSMVKVYYQTDTDSQPVLHHHGRVLLCETTCDEDNGYTVLNSSDPLELWAHRPVRDDDGDFSLPLIIDNYVNGPDIIAAMFQNSETAGAGPPSDAEGPLRMALGTVNSGTVDLSGAPVDWPMTMAQLATMLISTGTVDVIVSPIEFDGNNNYARLDLYPGDFGNDLSSSVAFQYGMGARNVRALRWNENMSQMCNKLWYYLGPKITQQRWQENITGDDPGLAYPPGGALSPPAASLNNQLGVARVASQAAYDVRMDIRIYDGRGDESAARELFRRLWQVESWFRTVPQTLIHVTPTRDTGINEFDIGDLVLVEATSEVRGGFSGAQRVYAYTISWDADDSVPSIGELQVSSDAEGM